MNNEYRRLKQKYDDISKQISNLHKEQSHIRNLMEEVCTHENLIKVDPEPFFDLIDVVDEETKFKCNDCYRYFSKEEIDLMKTKPNKN